MILLFFLSLYNLGNDAFEKGDYKQAVEYYQEALKHSENPKVYYNLGVAYFKMGRLGYALKYTKRAWFLDPKDPDINYNLTFIRKFRPDQTTKLENPIIFILGRVCHHFSLYECGILAALLFLITGGFIAGDLVLRRKIFRLSALITGLLFFYFFISCQIWLGEMSSDHGVVIADEAVGYSGPGSGHTEVFVIHDGLEVRIVESRKGYYLIQIPGGLGGWVKKEKIERI
ncbi:MAG TPA: tetratricopeptide repeat protein [bacterium (Candidatus Stahlbacteria)]|nr:tetratricopeptide repeat protein [Candidatus Stahlbacteria bacterium]